MANLSQVYSLMFDETRLKERVTAALFLRAGIVMTEDSAVVDHAKRLVTALRVQADPKLVAKDMMLHVIANSDVQQQGSLIDDAALEWIVNDAWNRLNP